MPGENPNAKRLPVGGFSIRWQLLLTCLPLMLLLVVSVTYVADRLATAAVREQVVRHLESVREQRRLAIESYIRGLKDQVALIALDPNTVRAFERFRCESIDLENHPGTEDGPLWPHMVRLKGYLQEYYSDELATGALALEDLLVQQRSAVWLQAQYLAGSPKPTGHQDLRPTVGDGIGYGGEHAMWHPGFQRLMEMLGLGDVLLVDAKDGRIVYSAAKRPDFQTNLVDGPYTRSSLGLLFRRVLASGQGGEVVLTDFASYIPQHGQAVAFAGAPIIADGVRVGMVFVQLSLERIGQVLSAGDKWEDIGLGASGDVFLVGSDSRLRSPPRFPALPVTFDLQKGAPGAFTSSPTVESRVITMGGDGRAFTGRYVNHRGVSVFGTVSPLAMGEPRWSVVTEISEAEALRSLTRFRRLLTYVVLCVSVVAAAWVLGVAWWIARSVRWLVDTVRALQQGDMDARVPVRTRNELGVLARELNTVLDRYAKVRYDQAAERQRQAADRERQAAEVRELVAVMKAVGEGDCSHRARVDGVFAPLANGLNGLCAAVQDTAQRLRGVPAPVVESTIQMRAVTEQLVRDAGAQIEGLSRAMTTIDEMSATVGGLASRVTTAVEVAHHAEQTTCLYEEALVRMSSGIDLLQKSTRASTAKMKRLGERSMEVSAVVDIVAKIAAEANRLALNAAIDAARAGENGKGASVVAGEVRRLAERTELAREEIGRVIDALQSETHEAVGGVDRQAGHVEKHARSVMDVARLADGLLPATVQCASTVSEMSVAVSRQADEAVELTGVIGRVAEEAQRTRQAAEHVQGQVATLLVLANELDQQVRLITVSGDPNGSPGGNGNLSEDVTPGGVARV